MAAAAAANASGLIQFKVLDTLAKGRPPFGWSDPRALDLLPTRSFDPDAHSFLDVVRWHLDAHPADNGKTLSVNMLRLGTDVSLDTPLRDWMAALDMHSSSSSSSRTPVLVRVSNCLGNPIEYEKIQYALAARGAGLAWPLWDKEDTDPINMQVTGTYDNYRNRSGSPIVAPEEDNDIRNLIGLRRGHHLKFVNMHALAASFTHGNRREPAFHTEIANMDVFVCDLAIARQDSASPSRSDPMHTLLPIVDLETGAVDRRYGSTFAAYDRDVRARLLAAEMSAAATALTAHVRSFLRSFPDAPIEEAEAGARQERVRIHDKHAFPLDELARIVRTEYRAANPRPSADRIG